MLSNMKFKIIFVLIILAGSIYYLWPTIYLSRLPQDQLRTMRLSDPQQLEQLQQRSIKLGLDLQGGMHMVLELDQEQMKMSEEEEKDAINRALEIIRTRVDQFGVREPLIQKAGDTRIIVELAGIVDTSRARQLVEQSAYLEFQLVKPKNEFLDVLALVDETIEENELYLLPEEQEPQAGQPGEAGADEGAATDRDFSPMDLFEEEGAEQEQQAAPDTSADAAEESSDTTAEEGGSLDELLGTGEAEQARDVFSRLFYQPPRMNQMGERQENYLFVPAGSEPLIREYLSMPEVQETIALAEVNNMVDFLRYRSPAEEDTPDTLEVLWSDASDNLTMQDGTEYRKIYLVKRSPELTGEYLSDANARLGSGYDPQTANKPLVLIEFTPEGADSFEVISETFLQRDLAIVLDNIIKSAPRIMSRIPAGSGAQITGEPTMESARDLAIVLRAGALPAPLAIAESRTVGPSLGHDSVSKGSKAAVIGLVLVLIFMLIYYKFGGLVANFALVFNMILIMAVLAGFSATLTLPGIAGLILTIGMAVDANVLIFERIREEMKAGKTLLASIDAGYDKAFSTILDANVTTFITAVVLFQFGTGPIKGFAVTLSIGLAASMFTAIYVTRIIFDLWSQRKSVKSIAL